MTLPAADLGSLMKAESPGDGALNWRCPAVVGKLLTSIGQASEGFPHYYASRHHIEVISTPGKRNACVLWNVMVTGVSIEVACAKTEV